MMSEQRGDRGKGRRGRRPAGSGSTRLGAAGSEVPRQRESGNRDVVVVVVSGDDSVNAVLAGAKMASDGEQPLALVNFADPDRSMQSNMVAVDRALTVARTAFPRLEVMVDHGLRDEPGWEQGFPAQVTQVVVDPSVAARWSGRDEAVPVTVVEQPG